VRIHKETACACMKFVGGRRGGVLSLYCSAIDVEEMCGRFTAVWVG